MSDIVSHSNYCCANAEGGLQSERGSVIEQFFDHLGIVLSHPVFTITLASYTIYTGVVGLVAYWGPKAAYAMFQIHNADIFMGITAGLTGVAGTIIGGVVLDQIGMFMGSALSGLGSIASDNKLNIPNSGMDKSRTLEMFSSIILVQHLSHA